MTPEAFRYALDTMADRVPFKPFTIELLNGRRLQIDHPRALAIGRHVVIWAGPEDRASYLDHTAVARVLDDLAHAGEGGPRADDGGAGEGEG